METLDYINGPLSHIDYWSELQRNGKVSSDVNYEEPPRGRVVYGRIRSLPPAPSVIICRF